MIDIVITKTGTQLKDFLSALVNPLVTNGVTMKQFEIDQTKNATWNGQKMVLQAALNDIFGITIVPFILVSTTPSIGLNNFFGEPSELSPVYFGEVSESDPVYFGEPSEYTAIDYDFIVSIPSGIYTTELERRVRAQVNIYKLAGKSFTTTTY